MDDEIKSAREIAMEKLAKMEAVTEQERLSWKYIPEGEKLAAQYLKGECNLVTEMGKYEAKAAEFVVQGASETLLANINLPRDDASRKRNKQAMEGLKTLKQDNAGVENVYSGLRRVFDHYAGQGEQQRQQAYQTLKTEFEAKVQQALQQQLGTTAGFKIDVESQPQFQEEWRRVLAGLDSQYNTLLSEYKQELSSLK